MLVPNPPPSSPPPTTILSLPQPLLERILILAATNWPSATSPSLPLSSWPSLSSVCRAFRVALYSSVRSVRLSDAYFAASPDATLSTHASAGPLLLNSALLRCSRLHTLDLTSCDNVGDDDVASFAARGPQLRSFVLTVCGEQTDASVIALARASGPKVRRVDLAGCERSRHRSGRSFAMGRKDACGALGNASLVAVATFCANLRCFSVANAPGVTDSGLMALAALSCLEAVSLTRVNRVTDGGIRALTNGRSKISSLSLFSNSELGDASLHAIANGKATKSSLLFFGITFAAVTDEGLERLILGVPSLDELQVDHCTGVSDTWMRCVGQAGGLSRISLRNCDFPLTSRGLSELGKPGNGAECSGSVDVATCTALDALNLGFVSRVDAGLLITLVDAAPQLEILVLDACRHVDDDACKVLSRFSRLRVLDISWCNVTHAGISSLCQSPAGPRLSCLSVGPVREVGVNRDGQVGANDQGEEPLGAGEAGGGVDTLDEVYDDEDVAALAAAMDASSDASVSSSARLDTERGEESSSGPPKNALCEIGAACVSLEELVICGYVEPATVEWLAANATGRVDYLDMKSGIGSMVYGETLEADSSMFL